MAGSPWAPCVSYERIDKSNDQSPSYAGMGWQHAMLDIAIPFKMFKAEPCPRTRFILAEILVLNGTIGTGVELPRQSVL